MGHNTSSLPPARILDYVLVSMAAELKDDLRGSGEPFIYNFFTQTDISHVRLESVADSLAQ